MEVGEACQVVPGFRKGVVAFIGPVAGLPEGDWVGVRLDQPEGKNDGTRDGVRYFECEANCGVFTQQKNLRPVSDRKAALSNRFAKAHSERQAEKDRKNATRDVAVDPTESIASFWKEFKATEESIQETLGELSLNEAKKGNAAITERLNGLQLETHQMQKSAAEASRYLPPFDVRQTQEIVSALTQKIEKTRASLVPRKKFTFGARQRAKDRAAKEPAQAKAAVEAPSETIFEAGKKAATTVEIPDEGFRFEHRSDETLCVQVGQLDKLREGQGKDGCLSHLKNCTVFILDVSEAIRIDQLESCKVYVGPVAGSVHLQNCTKCTFMIASRQIRIHDSYDCDYYLRVASNPIFEDCSRLRFAPYNLYYPELAGQMVRAGLEKLENKWQQVDDFKWHRAQHSPNWSELAAADMQTEVEGSAAVRIGAPGSAAVAAAGSAAAGVGPNNKGQPVEEGDDDSDEEL